MASNNDKNLQQLVTLVTDTGHVFKKHKNTMGQLKERMQSSVGGTQTNQGEMSKPSSQIGFFSGSHPSGATDGDEKEKQENFRGILTAFNKAERQVNVMKNELGLELEHGLENTDSDTEVATNSEAETQIVTPGLGSSSGYNDSGT